VPEVGKAEESDFRERNCMYDLKKKVPEVSRKSRDNGKNLRLGERDFAILRFILEMKNCSSEHVWEKFFREDDVGIKYCQNRLSRLRRGDFLLSHYTYDGPTRYYTGTDKARMVVMDFFGLSEDEIPASRKDVDLRQFLHDKGLTWARIFLEKSGAIAEWSWSSEASIIRKYFYGKSVTELGGCVIPDAVVKIISSTGVERLAALEFERTQKTPEKRREKIRGLFADDNKWAVKIIIFGDAGVENAWAETFKDVFLDKAKKWEEKSNYRTPRDFRDDCGYFSKQVLLTSTYNELAAKYKEADGKVKLVDFFKEEKFFFGARKILNGIEHKKELEEASRKRSDEEARHDRSGEKKEKKGVLGRVFSKGRE